VKFDGKENIFVVPVAPLGKILGSDANLSILELKKVIR
jgi:hypothetical protein